MLSRGQKIFIIVGGIAVLVIAVILIFMYRNPSDNQLDDQEVKIDESQPTSTEELGYQMPALTGSEKDRAEIHNLAMMFTERFGTYSNQGDFDHIDGLTGLMTDSFARWATTTYKRQLTTRYNGSTYASIQTEALAVEFEDVSPSTAVAVVSTRQILKTGGEPVITEPKLELKLVKNNTDWKIDGAFWQTQ